MCTECWTKIESFHTFYMNVKSIESQLLLTINEDKVKNENFPIIFDHVDTSVVNPEIKLELEDNSLISNDNEVIDGNSNQAWTEDDDDDVVDAVPKKIKRNPLKRRVKIKATSKIKQKVSVKKVKKSSSKKEQKKNYDDDDNEINDDIKLSQSSEQYKKDDERIREFFNLQCEKCTDNQLFNNLREIRTHFRIKHSSSRGYVKCCKRKFFRRSVLLEHLAWHLNPEQFR